MKIAVIGGSAGALEALTSLLLPIPPVLDMAFFVVIHYPANRSSLLPMILEKTTKLSTKVAVDGERIATGRVYLAAADRHLVVDGEHVRVVLGPKENAHRPSIDVLFRSAAYSAKEDAVGIVLSGMLDDGTAGLLTIKRNGGTTIVQDPNEAQFPDMPRSAMENVGPTAVLRIDSIVQKLIQMGDGSKGGLPMSDHRAPIEKDHNNLPQDEDFARPSAFVCPECEGTLWELDSETFTRYRCRVGHAYSEETLVAEKSAALEAALWAAVRALEEQVDLMKRVRDHARKHNTPTLLERVEAKCREAEAALETVRSAALGLDGEASVGAKA